MHALFCYTLSRFMTIYFDNVVAFSATMKDRLQYFHWVFQYLYNFKLQAKLKTVTLDLPKRNT